MSDLPTLSQKESPSRYGEDEEDIAIHADSSGGYDMTRPRFTRRPRRSFKSGYISIPHSDYLAFTAFYATKRTYVAFIWDNQITGETGIQVRFEKPLTISYKGVGQNRMWDIDFQIKEV